MAARTGLASDALPLTTPLGAVLSRATVHIQHVTGNSTSRRICLHLLPITFYINDEYIPAKRDICKQTTWHRPISVYEEWGSGHTVVQKLTLFT